MSNVPHLHRVLAVLTLAPRSEAQEECRRAWTSRLLAREAWACSPSALASAFFLLTILSNRGPLQ